MCLSSPFPGRPGDPFPNNLWWRHNHCFHILSLGSIRLGTWQSKCTYFPGVHTSLICYGTGQWIYFPGAALCSVIISCFHFLRHETTVWWVPGTLSRSLSGPVEAPLMWPSFGGQHHHYLPKGGGKSEALTQESLLINCPQTLTLLELFVISVLWVKDPWLIISTD